MDNFEYIFNKSSIYMNMNVKKTHAANLQYGCSMLILPDLDQGQRRESSWIRQSTPPRRNGGEMAEQILLPCAAG